MKPRVITHRLRQLLILVAAFVVTLETAFSQDNADKTFGYAQVDVKENIDTSMSHMMGANPRRENKDLDLLNEILQSDSANKTEELSAKEEPCDSNVCTSETPQ